MKDNSTRLTKINNRGRVSKMLSSSVIAVTLVYLTWWLNINHAGNIFLYSALVIGEIYHVWQAIGYAFTVTDQRKVIFRKVRKFYPVDIFITVCGEPAEVVEKTLQGVVSIDYPEYHVYVLNDGKSAGKDNWQEIDDLATRYGATPITRSLNQGAKAGNINNALKHTSSPFIVVFDADHIPERNFLSRTMGYFEDEKLALVQTPQYYANKDDNFVTKAAWEQQELFFGPICNGKNRSNATFWCGTNAVVRREALDEIGGVPTNNIAEDFLASLFIHERGWNTLYVPEVLARGLAPHNLGDYVNQQFRWARGSLEVIFRYNPLFRKGLSWVQKMQYLYSSGYYLNGIIVMIDALIPLLALGFNAVPVNANTADFSLYFFPFIFLTIYLLMISTKNTITFNAIQLSMSTFFVFFVAAISTIFGIKAKFKVTSKSKESGNYLKFALPHILYILVSIFVSARAIMVNGLTPSVITNVSWLVFNITFFAAFIKVSYPWEALWSRLTHQMVRVDTKPALSREKYVYTYVEAKKEEYEK